MVVVFLLGCCNKKVKGVRKKRRKVRFSIYKDIFTVGSILEPTVKPIFLPVIVGGAMAFKIVVKSVFIVGSSYDLVVKSGQILTASWKVHYASLTFKLVVKQNRCLF